MSAASAAAPELSLLAATLDHAVARLPVAPRLYRIAGDLVAIRAGERAAALLEAFTPMRASDDGDAVALEVFIFDGVSDRLALPDTAITHRRATQAGGLGAFAAPGAQAFFQPDAGVLSLFDASRRRAYCWLRDTTALPYYEFAAPLRHLL
jgi:hypothetical protein